MNNKLLLQYYLFIIILFLSCSVQAQSNIDATNKWAWGTNSGWINFLPTHGGVTIYTDHLEGYAWSENVGWIHFNLSGAISYKVATITDNHFPEYLGSH